MKLIIESGIAERSPDEIVGTNYGEYQHHEGTMMAAAEALRLPILHDIVRESRDDIICPKCGQSTSMLWFMADIEEYARCESCGQVLKSEEGGVLTEKPEELCSLIRANPELLILPVVRGTSYNKKCKHWGFAAQGGAAVEEYLNFGKVMLLKNGINDDDTVSKILEYYLSPAEWDNISDSIEARRQAFEVLPWQKAIMVFIEALE